MALFAPQLASAQTSTDTTVADFTAGDTAGTYVSDQAGGEVILQPTVGEEFASIVPADWQVNPWDVPIAGGSATVAGGQLVLDGASAGDDDTYLAGRSLEYVATFGGAPFQHVGFGVDFNASPNWAMFSVKIDGTFAARTNNGGTVEDTQLSLTAPVVPQRYRIEWSATGVRYLVNGVEVANHTAAFGTTEMRPLASDLTNGDSNNTQVDWLHMSDYPATGTFNSAVIDSGEQSDWGTLSSLVTIPAGTGVAFSVRTGDTPTPDGTWSDPIPVVNGNDIPASSRYLQYSAELSSTTDNDTTPVVNDVTVAFAPTPPEPPADTPAQPAQPAAPVVAGGTASSAAKKNCKKIKKKSKKKRKKCKKKQRG